MSTIQTLKNDFRKLLPIIEAIRPRVDPHRTTPCSEFLRRVKAVQTSLAQTDCRVGLVFSDEHYRGDVHYLGGNTNIHVEQVAGVVGPTGFHILAGLEGGYVAEQLAPRAGAKVHKVEMLQLADEKYPIRAERFEDVLSEAAGQPLSHVIRVALLTPRQVIPSSFVERLNKQFGAKNVVDHQVLYQKIKYEKSSVEMRLTCDAAVVADAMLRGMLAVLKPGMLETEVAAWGYWIGQTLGCEDVGCRIMCGAGEACRTMIGKPLNRRIREGDWVHLGVAPTRDGLNACVRRSVIAVEKPGQVKPADRYWFDFIAEAYQVGLDALIKNESLRNQDAENLDIMVDPMSLKELSGIDSIRPDGIACQVRASKDLEAIGVSGDLSLRLTEFPNPEGKVVYFHLPDLSVAVPDELLSSDGLTRCH